MSPEKAIARAEDARRILEDPLFIEAMKTLETDIVEAWARAPIRDEEGQRGLLLMLQTARKFKTLFETLVHTGEVAKNDLNPSRLRRTLDRHGIFGG